MAFNYVKGYLHVQLRRKPKLHSSGSGSSRKEQAATEASNKKLIAVMRRHTRRVVGVIFISYGKSRHDSVQARLDT